jgi:hypothetical protein
MSSSFGDNKRKPGAGASAVTEARRLATIAQTWTFPSKGPRVTTGTQVAGAVARNSGVLSLKYAEQNGYAIPPAITPIQYIDLDFSGGTKGSGGGVDWSIITITPKPTTTTTYFRILNTDGYFDRLTFTKPTIEGVEVYVNNLRITNLETGGGQFIQIPIAGFPVFTDGDIIKIITSSFEGAQLQVQLFKPTLA